MKCNRVFLQQPKFQIFFKNKSEKELKQFTQLLIKMRAQYMETIEVPKRLTLLSQMIDRQEEYERINDIEGISIDLLLDKAELVQYYIQGNQIDMSLIEEMFDANIVNNVNFDRLIIQNYPKGYKQYLINYLLSMVYILKLTTEKSVEKIEQLTNSYLEQIELVYKYVVKNFETIGQADGFLDVRQATIRYYNQIATFHLSQSQKLEDTEKIMEELQKSFHYFRESIQIINELLGSNNELLVQSAEAQNKEVLFMIVQIYKRFANICLSSWQLDKAREFIEQGLEIYKQILGVNSFQYINLQCDLAHTYVSTDIEKARNILEDLNQQISNSNDIQSHLMVKCFYFCINQIQVTQEDKLYDEIEQLRKTESIPNETLAIDYHIQALKYCLFKLNYEKILHHIEEFITLIKDQDADVSAMKILAMLDSLESLPDQVVQKSDAICLLYEILLPLKDQIKKDKLIIFNVSFYLGAIQFLQRKKLNLTDAESLTNFNQFFNQYYGQDQFQKEYFEKIMLMALALKRQQFIQQCLELLEKSLKLVDNSQNELQISYFHLFSQLMNKLKQ